MSIKRLSSISGSTGTWQDIKSIWRLNSISGSTGTWGQIKSMWRLNSIIGGIGSWIKIFSSDALSLSVSNVNSTNATFNISATGYSYFRLSIDKSGFTTQDLNTSKTYSTTALSANTVYTATVQGWTGAYTGFTTTATASFTTGPTQPTLYITDTTDTSVTVSWSSVAAGATSYQVSTNGTTWLSPTTTTTSHTFTGLTAGTNYTFYVRAFNSSASVYSTVSTITGSPLTAPSALTVTNLTSTTARLSWTGGSGNNSYRLYVSKSNTPPDGPTGLPGYFPYSPSAGITYITTTAVDVTGIVANTRYQFYVVGYTNNNGTGTEQTSTTTYFTTSPAAPTPSVSASSSTSVTISWTNVTGATSYRISRDGGVTWIAVSSNISGTTSYQYSTGLSAGTDYTIWVQSYSLANNLYSANGTVTATTLPNAPTQSATSTDNQITISWVGGAGTGSYRVWVWTSLSPLTTLNASVPYNYTTATTSLTISSGLNPGTIYYYQVVAFSKASQQGSIAYASPATNSIYTKLAAPILTQGTGIQTESQVQWAAVTGAAEYYQSTNGLSWTLVAGGSAARSYTFTGLTAGNSYTVYIRASNANTVGMTGSTTIYTAPSSFTSSVGSITQTGARISWTGPTNANSYKITVLDGLATTGGSPFNVSKTTTFQDISGLVGGITYSYSVNAYTTTTSSGPTTSSSGSFTTTSALVAPGPPRNVTITRNEASWDGISWTWSCTWSAPNTGGAVASYEAYRQVGTGTIGNATLTTITNTSTAQTGLTSTSANFSTTVQSANRADAYVRAVNAAGSSAYESGNVG